MTITILSMKILPCSYSAETFSSKGGEQDVTKEAVVFRGILPEVGCRVTQKRRGLDPGIRSLSAHTITALPTASTAKIDYLKKGDACENIQRAISYYLMGLDESAESLSEETYRALHLALAKAFLKASNSPEDVNRAFFHFRNFVKSCQAHLEPIPLEARQDFLQCLMERVEKSTRKLKALHRKQMS